MKINCFIKKKKEEKKVKPGQKVPYYVYSENNAGYETRNQFPAYDVQWSSSKYNKYSLSPFELKTLECYCVGCRKIHFEGF